MKRVATAATVLLACAALAGAETVDAQRSSDTGRRGTMHWPGFRGPDARGVTDGRLATSWNADPAAGELRNVRWKTPVPGLAHSSPAIWGDRLFVTTAVSSAGAAPLKIGIYGSGDPAEDNAEQSWVVYCLDKKSGKVLWERVAQKGAPKTKRHTKATHANSTPAVDGKRVVAYFGSEGVYCYDLDGKLLWKKDLGVFDPGPQGYDLQWGTASSPLLVDDRVILQCDQKKGSFLAVLSAADGREIWRADRDGISHQSWATPAVVRAAGRAQVVCNGWPYIASYDFGTGKELWRLRSGGDITVPTPVFAEGLIFVTNAHGGPAPLYAILPEASGDITPEGAPQPTRPPSAPPVTPIQAPAAASKPGTGLKWHEPRNGAYMQTPVVLGGLVYSCSDRGVLKVYDSATGQMRYTQRLGEGTTGFSASPVADQSKILFTSEEGEVYVLRTGPAYELLAKNLLGEIAMASPAVSEGVLYFRTRGHVLAIAER